jgi:hypothetical protein
VLRILGLAVAVALTLAGAQSEPSGEEAYTAGVRAAVDEQRLGRLFNQVASRASSWRKVTPATSAVSIPELRHSSRP